MIDNLCKSAGNNFDGLGSGQTERWSEDGNQVELRGSSESKATAGSEDMTWSFSSAFFDNDWAAIAVAIKPFSSVGESFDDSSWSNYFEITSAKRK